MKVLLAQNMPHAPSYGGANRSGRIMHQQLAARGHECHVLALAPEEVRRTGSLPAGLGASEVHRDGDVLRYVLDDVQAHVVTNPSRLVRTLLSTAARLRPDWILVPSDDPGGLMLGAATAAAFRRVVYVAHTLQQLPFGPRAFYPSTAVADLVRQAAGVVAVSRTAAERLRSWGGIEARLVYPAVYGPGPFPRADGTAVTMLNPCDYKGIDILLGLADAMPAVPFLAVASWGTGADDRARLARRANIEVVGPVDDIGPVLARTRVLLMPSLWDETFGYSAVEAMLRSVPVLASDLAGLREAKMGVPHLVPVAPIERYTSGPAGWPVPQVPTQDVRPWHAVLTRLLRDDAYHSDLADRSHDAATAFVDALDPAALEAYLAELVPATPRGQG